MFRLDFTQEMILSADAKAKNLGIINNSILKGEGSFAGYLAEEALVSHLKEPYFYVTPKRFPPDTLVKVLPDGHYYCKRTDSVKLMSNDFGKEKFNHDFIWGRHRFEVKAKQRTVDPEDHHSVSVAKTSEHQKPDYYAFLSITMDKDEKLTKLERVKSVWLCGIKKREDYFSQAEFIRNGSSEGDNNFIAHADMYNLAISDLQKIPPPNRVFRVLDKPKQDEFILKVPDTESELVGRSRGRYMRPLLGI